VNIAIGRSGFSFLRAAGETLAVDGEAPTIGRAIAELTRHGRT
jgi:hypothetical protein